jgi:hypothetical protein
MKIRHTLALCCAATAASVSAQFPSSYDLWDLSQGTIISASSETHPLAGTPGGLLGQEGQDNSNGNTWTYFADGQPDNFVHYIEWETAADVTIGEVRVFAFGDDFFNSGREFEQFTLKAKSPGSADYDVTVFTFTPTHPYTFVDPYNFLVIDQVIAPLTARSFRAEFTQYTAGNGWDGPRIVEIDGLPAPLPPPSSTDAWDVSQGALITGTSGVHPAAGTLNGLLGAFGQNNYDASTWTYFPDDQPADFVHYVEWETPADVTIAGVRLFAFGDDFMNNGREFAQFTLKAKSPGSATYDLTLLTFTPTHPYTFADANTFCVLNQAINPTTARSFRAEFLQYTAGYGYDGPRIVELDAVLGQMTPTDPPPSDPPPVNPPPSDPPPSDPPPSDPPPVNPPPTEPPPVTPPPSDPPPVNPPPTEPPPVTPPPTDPPPVTPPPSDPPPVTPPPPAPPTIVAAPESVTANYATPVVLSVVANGTGSLQYQWFKNNIALPGQTGEALYIPSLCAADAANYHVAVTGDGGATVSSDASIALDLVNILPSAFDLWDTQMGATISAHTDYAPLGAAEGMFGAGSAADDSGATYFADHLAAGTQHIVEWTTPAPVQVNTIRLFARGNGSSAANSREFGSFTLRAKSAGSARFDIVLGTFTPSHPYTFVDGNTFAILDAEIAPIQATAFRAEFNQYTAGLDADGPRVLELDAFTTRPLVLPAILVGPESQSAVKKSTVKFHVRARGGSLSFQWKYNGQNIAGATTDCLTIDTTKTPDRGTYSVVVSNALGSVESNPAVLTVVNKH